MSEILIIANSTGMGKTLHAELYKRLAYYNLFTEDESKLIADSTKVNTDSIQLHLVDVERTEALDDFLDDFWTGDICSLVKSDFNASGYYSLVDLASGDMHEHEFGPKNFGVRLGLIVPEFTPDPLVLNEELKDQPGIDSYDVSVIHDTSSACTITVYAASDDDAREQVKELDDLGELPYEDTDHWGDAFISVQRSE